MNFLQIIMGKTRSLRYLIRHSRKLGFRLIKPFYSVARFCILILRGLPHSIFAFIKYRKYYHQRRNYTCENRYPALFAICSDYFKNRENVKILSFGCSTGEEVYSINSYLPQATIIGTDINPYNLRQCNKKQKRENIRFIHALSEEISTKQRF
jgi:Methyltransferase domain